MKDSKCVFLSSHPAANQDIAIASAIKQSRKDNEIRHASHPASKANIRASTPPRSKTPKSLIHNRPTITVYHQLEKSMFEGKLVPSPIKSSEKSTLENMGSMPLRPGMVLGWVTPKSVVFSYERKSLLDLPCP